MPDEMNLQHEDVLPNDQLSDHDKAFMVINYPRSSVDPTATEWTLNHALEVMGVPLYDRHAMLLARPEDVRKQFAIWTTERFLASSADYDFETVGAIITTPVVVPDWYRRACSDLANHEAVMVDESQAPDERERAVITRTDNLWPNASVS